MASGELITGTKFWRGRYRCGGSICTGSCKSGHVDGLSKDQDGNRFKSKAAATKAATLREIEVRKSVRQINTDRTFKDAAQRFCDADRGIEASTMSGYREQTRSFFNKFPAAAGLRIVDVTTDHIDEWLIAIRDQGLKQNPIKNYRKLLHAIFKHAERKGWVTVNPVLNADTPTSIHKTVPVAAFTEDELNRLADAIDPRYSLLVLLGGYGGLRIAELFGLRARDVVENINGGLQLYVAGQFQNGEYKDTTKTKTVKTTPVAPHIVTLLRHHLKDFSTPADRDRYLFTTPSGDPIDYHNFMNRVWRPALAAAGLPALGTHSMRHHFADYCRDRGVPIEVAADWGGWSSSRMIEDVYRTKNSDKDIDKYADLLTSDLGGQSDDMEAAS